MANLSTNGMYPVARSPLKRFTMHVVNCITYGVQVIGDAMVAGSFGSGVYRHKWSFN
jgi:hypothetical protein